MATDAQPAYSQPDFLAISRSFRAVANELEKFPNLPMFNQGTPIMASLERIEQRLEGIDQRLGDLDQRLATIESSMTAR